MRAPRWLRRRQRFTFAAGGIVSGPAVRVPLSTIRGPIITPDMAKAAGALVLERGPWPQPYPGVQRLREDLGVCDAPGHWRFPHERLGRPFPCQHWSAIPVQPRPLPLLAGRLWNDPPLAWVHGPWPTERVDRPIPITPAERSWLINFQGDSHITVDGELGPQTWVELAHYNTRERRAS